MDEILIIDDNECILHLISKVITRAGYTVHTAVSAKEGFEILNKHQSIKLIIVDLRMPEIDGSQFCQMIRRDKIFHEIPIIMVTAMSDINNKSIGFESGVDDYLTKPFENLELIMRVKSLLKRRETQLLLRENYLGKSTSELIIDEIRKTLMVKGKNIYLTMTEFDIFNYLYTNSNKLVGTEDILTNVFKYPDKTASPEIVRTHIRNIRTKIEDNPSDPKYLMTVSRKGYTVKSS